MLIFLSTHRIYTRLFLVLKRFVFIPHRMYFILAPVRRLYLEEARIYCIAHGFGISLSQYAKLLKTDKKFDFQAMFFKSICFLLTKVGFIAKFIAVVFIYSNKL